MELVELGEAIIHVFEGEIGCGDPRALIELPRRPGGVLFDLQRGVRLGAGLLDA
jgi:hypothetical protein